LALGLVLAGGVLSSARTRAQDNPPAAKPGAGDDQEGARPGPEPIPAFQLSTLKTVPVRREGPGPNWIQADASPLPKDPDGIWVLEFSYKPVRLIEVEIPNKGRRKVHYLYYRVVNRTGQTRRFVPQFTLVAHNQNNGKRQGDIGQRYEDVVLPLAAKKIQAKEDPTKDLSGAVTVMGELPPSTKNGIDDAFYGVAIWDNVDFRADSFEVYVRGLSNAYQIVEPPAGAEPITRYKALRLDFIRFGDERSPHNREIHADEPAYEWTYFP
jgi:hypothetical protein